MEVRKEGKEKIFIDEEWKILEPPEAFRVAEALSDPLRQWIYTELDSGPLRQAELAKRASRVFGRNITNPLLRYHIAQLERAGLVRSEMVPSPPKGAKMIQKNAEVRIQLRYFTGQARADLEKEVRALFGRWKKSAGA
ncbi:MAG: winged helix-turn-helix domain-containing protein [Candidatus Hadarchaeales archaeon]